MNLNEDEGLILTIRRTKAQDGIVHAEPCECHELIQVGAQEEEYLDPIEKFLSDLASLHNSILVGCTDCGWEGFVGPGDKVGDKGNKVVVDEGSCPRCEGDLINLQKQECDCEEQKLGFHYDEVEIIDHD
jgi:hypothetical protein